MSTINPATINVTVPILGNPTTQSVRDNFAAIKANFTAAASDIDTKQTTNAVLTAIVGLGNIAADQYIYGTGPNNVAYGTITAYGRSVVAAANAAAIGLTASDIEANKIGTPTYSSVQANINTFHSAGIVSGLVMSDGGAGTLDVSAGSGFIRDTNTAIAPLFAFDIAGVIGLALTNDALNYIYVEYNAGTPQIVATTSERTDLHTNVLIGNVYKYASGELHINTYRGYDVGDHASKMITRMQAITPMAHETGAVISETGTLNFALTAGAFWEGFSRLTTAPFDSSVAGTFRYFYRDGIGGWTEVLSQTAIDTTHYDDGSGTLAVAGVNRYTVHWVYEATDSDVYVVYGQGSYLLAAAQDAQPADIPPHIEAHGRLVGKIIVQESATAFYSAESAFDVSFGGSGVSDHQNLTSIGVYTHTQIDAHIDDTTSAHPWVSATGGIKTVSAQAVGVDTTTLISDFTTAASALMVGDSAVITGKNTGTGGWVDIMQNTYYSVTGFVHRYIGSDVVSKYTVGYGGHYWYVAPTGVAGNTVTLTTAMQINTYAAGYQVLVHPSQTSDTGPQLAVGSTAQGLSQDSSTRLRVWGSSGVRVYTAGVNLALDIDGSQNLGIKRSPYTGWGSNYDVVDIEDAALFGYVSTWLGQNVYHNNTNFLYKTTAAASFIQLSSAGNISFQTAPSGTADTTATFSENLLLSNAGGVMIPERTAAVVDIAGYGQLWIKNDVPNTLYFTDDTGVDYPVAGSTVATSPWNTITGGISYTSGNVAIGIAALDTWSGSFTAMQLGGSNSIFATTAAVAGGAFHIGHNTYNDGAGYKYLVTDEAALYQIWNGEHIFQVAASGTIDTAISFIEPMRVYNTGVVRVQGNPTATATKLWVYANDAHVDGTMKVEQDGTGDASVWFNITGVASWAAGIDNSDSQTFVITPNSDLANGQFRFRQNGGLAIDPTSIVNWGGNYPYLQLGETGGITCLSGTGLGNEMSIVNNAYRTNTAWKYTIASEEASRFYMANGTFYFQNAATGIEDADISWTTIATIDATGIPSLDGVTLLSDSLTPTSALAVGLSSVLANGDYSIAVGFNAVAQEANCISIGRQTTTGQTSGASVEQRAVALGYNTRAYETDCISIGYNAVSGKSGTSADPQAIAIGPSSLADAGSSTAIGYTANSRGFGSTAIGYLADAREFECIAIGDAQAGQTADGSAEQAAIAIGPNCFAYETRGIAIGDGAVTGQNTTSLDPNSIAIGYLALADQEDAVAIGRGSDARGTSCVGIGDSAQALETSSVAIGINAQTGQSAGGTTYTSGVAIGPNAKGFDVACVAIGSLANAGITADATNPYAVAVGYSSESFGSGAVAVGANTDAKANGAIAVGQGAFARELNTIAIGDTSQAGQTNDASTEQTAIAIGSSAKAYELGCVALGGSTVAGKNGTSLDPYAVAVGYAALATADYGVAIGPNAESRGSDSVALGRLADARETHSIAIGSNSRAGTTDELATNIDSIAIGYSAVADLDGSIAIGSGATVATANVAVIGGNNKQINDLYIGKGETNGSPIDVGIHPTSALGTNIAGGNLEIAGGRSTGTGAGGSILFQTSPAGATGATLNALSTRMQINSSGHVGIGNTSGFATWSSGVPIEVSTNAAIWATGTQLFSMENAYYNSGWKYRSTAAASQYNQQAGIHYFNVAVSGTVDTAITWTEALTIDASANIAIGSAALATTATDGFLYIPTCAGAPTGTPTTKTGRVPLIFDTTNNNLYVYDGSWISVALA